jgi:hypothetical protein
MKQKPKPSFWATVVSKVFGAFKRPWAEFLKAIKNKARAQRHYRAELMQKLNEKLPAPSRPPYPRKGRVNWMQGFRFEYAQELKRKHPELNRMARRTLCQKIKFAKAA